MNVIIPDTNVILATALKFTYDGTIHTQHPFHVESSQLLDVVKDKITYPDVSGICLPNVYDECRKKFKPVFSGLRTIAAARRIVRNVASKAAKEAAENMAKKAIEVEPLQAYYFQIIVKGHHLSHPRDIESEDLSHDTPIEIVYLRNLYSILPVTYINWKKFDGDNLRDRIEFVLKCASHDVDLYNKKQKWHRRDVLYKYNIKNLWHEIKSGIMHMRLNYSSIKNARLYCLGQMSELIGEYGCLEKAAIPKGELHWHVENETTHAPPSQLRVKEMFDKLSDKYEDVDKDEQPLQYAEHKKSEECDEHPHDNDKLILAQADRHKINNPRSKIYIASNDKKFFSPHKGDSTITDAIYVEFKIRCDTPKNILIIVLRNSVHGA